ncbi:MAG: hypothetical protein WC714_28900 [Candidatus Obscuribacterales bacterium]|jgi:hypothetical protein
MDTNFPSTAPLPDNVRVLPNGVFQDKETGRFLPGGTVTTAIADPSQARAMVERKMELKRERIMAGANRVVAEGGQYDGTDLDFVEAISEAATITALNPDSKHQITAADFIFREAGIGEKQQHAQPQTVNHVLSLDVGVASQIAALLADMAGQSGQLIGIISNDDVVDAQAQDIGILGTGTQADEAGSAGDGGAE